MDNDCDGEVDEGVEDTYYYDGDGDGYGGSSTIQGCSKPAGYVSNSDDCNDGNASMNPGASEVCDDVDNDCDGSVDEGVNRVCGQDTGQCSTSTQYCTGGQWGSCQGNVGPSVEICDGLDNDCDNKTDEGVNQVCGTNTGQCSTGIQYCTSGQWGSCQGNVGPSPEICDNADNDCDGRTDKGLLFCQ